MQTQSSTSRANRVIAMYWSQAVLALVVLFVIVLRVQVLQVPLERDEGEYAYSAQLMLHGTPPYLMAYTMKLPGVSVMYALFMNLFGETRAGIHLGLLIVNSLTIVMVYFLGRRIYDPVAGVVAGAAFAILSLSQGVFGIFAHATNFVILFALAGILLLLRGQSSGRVATLFCSGLFFGFAFLMKQPGIFFAVFALIYFLWERRTFVRDEWQKLVRDSLVFSIGIMLPVGICCLVLVMFGTFDKFWFYIFKYAIEYVSYVPFNVGVKIFQREFAAVFYACPFLWILGGAGILLLFVDGRGKRARVFSIGLLFFSFLSICPGLYFRGHYFVMLLPAIALLNGIAIASARHLLLQRMQGAFSWIIPTLLFVASASYTVYHDWDLFFTLDMVTLSRKYHTFNPFPESIPIANYIREHSLPNDHIAVLGSEPQIYFYSNRLSASGYIYMYGLMEDQAYAKLMQEEMIKEIEAAKPKFVIWVNIYSSWLTDPWISMLFNYWAKPFLEKSYQLVGITELYDPETVYRWDADASGYSPRTDSFITVYKRKN